MSARETVRAHVVGGADAGKAAVCAGRGWRIRCLCARVMCSMLGIVTGHGRVCTARLAVCALLLLGAQLGVCAGNGVGGGGALRLPALLVHPGHAARPELGRHGERHLCHE